MQNGSNPNTTHKIEEKQHPAARVADFLTKSIRTTDQLEGVAVQGVVQGALLLAADTYLDALQESKDDAMTKRRNFIALCEKIYDLSAGEQPLVTLAT